MKRFSIILSMLQLFFSVAVSGQNIVFSQYARSNVNYLSSSATTHKKHCVTMRIGEGIMISGSAVVIAGLVDYKQQKNISYATSVILGNTIAEATVFAFSGMFICILSKEYERNHNERFTIFGKQNQIGLAYNF